MSDMQKVYGEFEGGEKMFSTQNSSTKKRIEVYSVLFLVEPRIGKIIYSETENYLIKWRTVKKGLCNFEAEKKTRDKTIKGIFSRT